MKINLDVELLRSLVAFADSGSFKLAAQLVYRTPPAVSMQMRRLEELVGHALFQKRGRDIAFTDKGLQLALQARQLLALHDAVVDELHGRVVQGKLRVGLPDDYAMMVLPHVLAHLSERYPDLPLDVVANTSPRLEKLLESGELDLAILATDAPRKGDVVLAREDIVWVASPDHDVHRQRPLRLALFSDESPIYRATVASFSEFAHDDGAAPAIEIVLRSGSWSVLTTAAAAGFAVATMARSVVIPGLSILGRAEGFPNPGQVAVVLRRTPDSQSIATSRLADEILEGFRAQAPVFPRAEDNDILRRLGARLAN